MMRVINAFQLIKAPVGKRPTGFRSLWRFLGKSGNLQPVLLQVSGQKNREHEQGGGGWGRRVERGRGRGAQKQSERRQTAGGRKTRVDIGPVLFNNQGGGGSGTRREQPSGH